MCLQHQRWREGDVMALVVLAAASGFTFFFHVDLRPHVVVTILFVSNQ